jgi:hypothetical protein
MNFQIPRLVAAIGLWVIAAGAHHSISGPYDTSQQMKLEGVVAQFHFVNPHPFLTVEVKRGDATQQWRLEMDNRRELVEIGMTEGTLKPGDRVVASGSPGRSGAHALYIRRLDRPDDGFWYEQRGGSPRMRGSR